MSQKSKEEILEEIKKDIQNHKIIAFIKGEKLMPVCGYSRTVVNIFHQLGVPFETRNVLQSEEYLRTLKEYTQWPTTPQVFINGEFIGGCDITLELYESGELQKKIEKALQAEN
ncbi:MAG: Grx4 family monothiol glutaredoxin [Planctomycetota bacterium]|nr:MAG: Grx4 family monothiol glutaredoxin [Planctomycetota bacterium]